MQEIKKRLAAKVKEHISDFDPGLIEVPPDQSMGDFAIPCFFLSKRWKKSPQEIARELAEKFRPDGFIEKSSAVGPYLNFFISRKASAEIILKSKEMPQLERRKKIVMEFSSPNSNKPQHLGHTRNNLLGMSISNILSHIGHEVVRTNLVNDRGIHICYSMLAYKNWGNREEPGKKKGDHLVGDYYVLFQNKAKDDKKLEEEAQEMLRRWEAGDPQTIELWKKLRAWVLAGFDATYKRMGTSFDKYYYESELYKEGKEIVMEAVEDGIAQKEEDGAVSIDLTNFGLDKKYLLRADGTSIYITQDIFLAQKKFQDYNFDESIYVVASEQNYHFKVLFKICELLGLPWAKSLIHLSYGMVNLPHGRMKSREGTVVDADDLMDEMHALAEKEVRERYKELDEPEIQRRSEIIGLAALKFYVLRTDPSKDMVYIPEESISFQGETGPYVQYSYARIKSILSKPEAKGGDLSLDNITEKESGLIKQLGLFHETIAASQLRPSLLCRYLLDLCQLFNEYYHDTPILKAIDPEKTFRLFLIARIADVLQLGLRLLGIETLEQM